MTRHVRFGSNCNVSMRSDFEGYNSIGADSTFSGIMGKCSYIGNGSHINGSLGRFCSVSDNVVTVIGSHPTNMVSTSPTFYSTSMQNGLSFVNKSCYHELVFADVDKELGVVVGNDVWIGYGVTIMGGVTIGDGAIIGANATVTKDIPAYAIAMGTPAKVVKYRFSKDQIDYLMRVKWWEWSLPEIKKHAELFLEVDRFIESKKAESSCNE